MKIRHGGLTFRIRRWFALRDKQGKRENVVNRESIRAKVDLICQFTARACHSAASVEVGGAARQTHLN